MNELKLYCFNLNGSYSGGLAVAIAKDEESARKQILKGRFSDPTYKIFPDNRRAVLGRPTVFPLDEPMAELGYFAE